ncbi:MAG: matrixin family metalloprotease [Terriglobia bacterium]
MNRQKMVMGSVVLLGMCSAVLLFATTFQLTFISSSDYEKANWPTTPISWSLNPSNPNVYSSTGTLANEAALASVLDAAFTLWSGAQYQSTSVNTLSFAQGADNTNTAFILNDCVNSIGFTGSSLATGIIAETSVTTYSEGGATGFTYLCTTAPYTRTCPNKVCITDADIEFSSSFNFSTPSYTNPPDGYFDLQTTATHEIGHMIGLGHTGLANAVMYPYGDSGTGGVKYSLALDDEIGSEVLYPNSDIQSLAGAIKGTVTVGGSAAFGAHVVAIDSTTGNVITDTLSDNDGNYELNLMEGNYYVLVLPLATDISGDSGTNGVTTINNYTGFACGYAANYSTCSGVPANPVDFTGTYY